MKKFRFSLEKAKEIIYRASLVILLGMFLYVMGCALVDFRSMPFLAEKTTFLQKVFFMGLGIVLLAQILVLIQKWIKGMQEKNCQRIFAAVFVILFVCQMVFLYTMKIQLRYDALKVLDEAVSVCKTGSVSNVHLDGYFARYTNNYPILFLTAGLLKVGRVVGLIDADYHGAVLFLGVVNSIAVDAAIFVLAKLLCKLSGIRSGLLFLLCVAGNPLFVIWVPFYYTNTMALPFLSLVLFLFYLTFLEKRRKNICLPAFFLGICLLAGIQIRATTILTLVACLLFVFLAKYTRDKDCSRGRMVRETFFKISCILAGVAVSFFVYKIAETRLVPFDYSDTAFPAIHWVNMGAGGTGEYQILDEQFTMSFETAEEKKEANWKSYQERVSQQGIGGYVSLMFQKLKLTFADGGAGYRSELGVSDGYNDANMYLVGGKSDLPGYLIQLFHVFGLLCLVYGVGKLLFFRERCCNYLVVVFWNIAGAFLFHMLWEAGNIYSLSFALLFPVAISFVWEDGKNVSFGKVTGGCRKMPMLQVFVSGLILVLTFAGMVSLYASVTREAYETNDAVVNQYIYHWGEMDELEEGEVILQSFYGNRPFNRLAFQVRNRLYEENDGVYRIELLDEAMTCLQSFGIEAKDYGDYDFIRLEVDEVKHPAQRYYVRIVKVAGSPRCNLVFLSYHTGNYDAYSYGELTGGASLQDLCFSVYMTKEEPYCSKKAFIAVFAILLSLEAAIQICFLHCLRGDRSPTEDSCRPAQGHL